MLRQAILWASVALLSSGCSDGEHAGVAISSAAAQGVQRPVDHNDKATSDSVISILETAVGMAGACRVGVSNIFVETFTDDEGKQRQAPRVSLSIFGGPPCQNKTVRVYQGQHVKIGEQGFVVTKVTVTQGGRGSVELARQKG